MMANSEVTLIKEIDEWEISKNRKSFFFDPSVRVVIAGKTGVGKSTLANFLTNSQTTESNSIGPSTSSSGNISTKVGQDEIIVWDTPGFTSITDIKSSSTRYIKELKKTCIGKEDCDVFLYVIDMRNRRFNKDDENIEIMKRFTEDFGIKIWKNAVIVLTFANLFIESMKERLNPEDDLKKHYNERQEEWDDKIHRFLGYRVIPEELAQNVKIVPVGFRKKSRLETEPEGASWMSDLWFSILHAAKIDAKPVIMRILINRIFDMDPKLGEYNGEMLTRLIPKLRHTYQQKAIASELECSNEMKANISLAWSSLYLQKVMLKNTDALQHLESRDESLAYWKSISSSVDITVVGGSKSGKTSLMNSLFYGKKFLNEKERPEIYHEILKHEYIKCCIWDTTSLQTDFKNMKSLIDSNSLKTLGLFLLCIRIRENRDDVTQSIKKITSQFGKDVWRHVVIVLTFANIEDYADKIEPQKNFIRKQLKEAMLIEPNNDYSDEVKIIPAGYHKNDSIPTDSEQTYWVVKLWTEMIASARDEFKPALVQIFFQRFNSSSVKPMVAYFQHQLVKMLQII